jgi:hypothetical protein
MKMRDLTLERMKFAAEGSRISCQEEFMAAIFSRLLPVFLFGSAYASEPQDVPPQAGMATIVIFLVLFIGLCAGFFAYLWWNEKKRKEGEANPKD